MPRTPGSTRRITLLDRVPHRLPRSTTGARARVRARSIACILMGFGSPGAKPARRPTNRRGAATATATTAGDGPQRRGATARPDAEGCVRGVGGRQGRARRRGAGQAPRASVERCVWGKGGARGRPPPGAGDSCGCEWSRCRAGWRRARVHARERLPERDAATRVGGSVISARDASPGVGAAAHAPERAARGCCDGGGRISASSARPPNPGRG